MQNLFVHTQKSDIFVTWDLKILLNTNNIKMELQNAKQIDSNYLL